MKQSQFIFLTACMAAKIGKAHDRTYYTDESHTEIAAVAWEQYSEEDTETPTQAVQLSFAENKLTVAAQEGHSIDEDLFIWLAGLASIHEMEFADLYIDPDHVCETEDDEEVTAAQMQKELSGSLH